MAKGTKKDARQHLVDSWIEQMEAGVAPWVKPWKCQGSACGRPRNFESKRAYSGVNVFTLLASQMQQGFNSSEWITFSGVKRLGGSVLKGSHGTWILQPVQKAFWRTEEDEDTGEEKKVKITYWTFKGLKLFNIEQTTIEWTPEEPATEEELLQRIEAAEAFISAQGAQVSHGGDRAYYSTLTDSIRLPEFQAFQDEASYYSTSLHEHAHWTGHSSRMDRDLSGTFGSEDYAYEELVAEMTAAFLCLDLRIEGQLQHAEYLGAWAKKLQNDPKFLTDAARDAEQAATWLAENAKKEQQAAAA